MRKSFYDKRLSSTMNARMDLVAPKKELENAEKQIEKVRKEAQKSFEREKQVLQKKLETLPSTRRSTLDTVSHKSGRMLRSEGRRISNATSSVGGDRYQADQLPGKSSRDSFALDFSGQDDFLAAPTGPVDKQADALRQLKFLYDCAAQLVAGADAAHKPLRPSRQTATDVDDLGDDKSVGTASRVMKDSGMEDTSKASTLSRKESTARGRHISFTSDSLSIPATGKRFSTTSAAIIFDPGLPQSLVASMDFQGPPSQAVQLISMVRMLSIGHTMEAKEMKALTAVIEESRIAVKSVKSGVDPDRAQERLVKKLNELLDLVKPKGSDLIISPEELLRCSYLRLSKENISRLEEMIRERGMEPGIHCHSDMQAYMDKLESSLDDYSKSDKSLPIMPLGESSNIQPVSVFLTKAGAPIDKARIIKPENIPGPSMEEEMARLKKFRAT